MAKECNLLFAVAHSGNSRYTYFAHTSMMWVSLVFVKVCSVSHVFLSRDVGWYETTG